MVLTLGNVLRHPLIVAARPELLSGRDQMTSPVRWVHSADLYDIAPLLRGREVLLTNGVGLIGLDESHHRHYVRSLHTRGITALFFEIGRTFETLPDAIRLEAIELNFPLVVLEPVLRFTEVAEVLNSLVIDASVSRLKYADEISQLLSERLARGGSLEELVQLVGQYTGGSVELRDGSGKLAALSGAASSGPTMLRSTPVLVESTVWGRLTLETPAADDLLIDAVLDRAPGVIGLCLLRDQPGVTADLRIRQDLLEQLVSGQMDPATLAGRLSACGLPTSEHDYVCVVAESTAERTALSVLHELGRTHMNILVGALEGGAVACAVIVTRHRAGSSVLTMDLRDKLRRYASGGWVARAAVGKTEADLADLPRSMSETRRALTFASADHEKTRVILTQNVALRRFIDHLSDLPELRRFVDEQLGPLIASDARFGGQLTQTLDVVIHARTKTDAALQLNIRRQSLYYRLDRISELLDVDLGDPDQLAAFSMALAGRQALQNGHR